VSEEIKGVRNRLDMPAERLLTPLISEMGALTSFLQLEFVRRCPQGSFCLSRTGNQKSPPPPLSPPPPPKSPQPVSPSLP
jgi:hypothetical protein